MNKSYFLASLPFFIGSLFGNGNTADPIKKTEETQFVFSADFIYWNVRQTGLEYAALGIATATVPLTKGDVYTPNFEWSPGFKVGLGLDLPHDGWDLYANYTWIHSHAHNSTGPAAPYLLDMAIFLAFNGLTGDTVIQNTSDNWKFRFNNIDLELGKTIFLPKHFLVRPYFGLKGTWQDNDVLATFNFSTIGTFKDHVRNEVWGIGLRGGLFSRWDFVKHWGIYGNFAASTLWLGNEASRNATKSIPSAKILDMNETTHSVLPVLEMGIGLSFDTGMANDRYHFTLSAGWEFQDWISYNEMIKLVQVGHKGDLVMQGLTVHTRFDF